jgi:alpha-glucosidase (family GH31 glycosyl hydrolase)
MAWHSSGPPIPGQKTEMPDAFSARHSIRAIWPHVVAIDCHSAYSRSKPSLLVPQHASIAEARETADGRRVLETSALRVEADDTGTMRVFRVGEAEPICTIVAPSPDGAEVRIDRGYPLYGVGGNNAWCFRTQDDIDELTSIDLDRKGHNYRIHHRETGQGNNFMPWFLSAEGFGVFADCTFPMDVDLRDGVHFSGRNIRSYYIVDGPTPAEALGGFVRLTGMPPMHPGWALGFEQSSRSWMGFSELDFVTTYMREKQIPCDGFDLLTTYGGDGGVGRSGKDFHAGYLDYYQGWHPKGSYKSYNPKLLPNGARDIATLRERGFRPIVHGYWMGDYSDPAEMEDIWQTYKGLAADGFSGWWLDGVEYCDVGQNDSPDTSYAPKNLDKFTPEFRDEHDNVWALIRAKAFYEKQRRDFPDRRVYILNRTVFPGVQAFATGVNQGDYWSSWRLMRIQTVWLLQMQMSGVMFPESDIGGHWPTGELTDELFIRWAFLGLFSPLMRSHGHNWRVRLPWGFGPENEARYVPLIRLRSVLFPYNYTALRQAHETGLPMMRAMALAYPSDHEARRLYDQYMWGDHLLVAPVYEKGATRRNVYLPDGRWVHWWTLTAHAGRSRIDVEAPMARDPLFVRTGTVIPMRAPSGIIPSRSDAHLTLLVLPGDNAGSFELYDDDRETYAYERGEFSRQRFDVSKVGPNGEFTVTIGAIEGEHHGIARSRTYRIEVPLSLAQPRELTIDGRELKAGSGAPSAGHWHRGTDRIVIETAEIRGPAEIKLR